MLVHQLFTLLQPEMPTDGVRSGRCDEPLRLRPDQTFHLGLAVKLLGVMLGYKCWPTTFHTYYRRRCRRMLWELAGVISPPQAPIEPNFPSGSSREIVGGVLLGCRCWPNHFPHWYNQRCWWMGSEAASVTSPQASITPNFSSSFSREIVGDYAKK